MSAPPPTLSEMGMAVSDAIAAVDERARRVNRKWGTNRLPHLVPFEWTEKYRSQQARWSAVLFASYADINPEYVAKVRKQGEAMIRAFDKLEELAREAGHEPTDPQPLELELRDGSVIVLVRDQSDQHQVDKTGRNVAIWSLDEIAGIIERFPDVLGEAKRAFPGAEVLRVRTAPALVEMFDDPVPF